MIKNITLYVLTLFLINLPAYAQESKGAQSGETIPIDVSDGVTIIVLPGQNTNGEDLKCVIYEAFGSDAGAGGIDCNWTPANLQQK